MQRFTLNDWLDVLHWFRISYKLFDAGIVMLLK